MSILHYNFNLSEYLCPPEPIHDTRFERNALGDLKHGLDLIFALKTELDKLHPIASETLVRMLSH